MKKTLLTLFALATAAGTALADVVYVTALTSNCTTTTICGNAANSDLNVNFFPVYNPNGMGSFTAAISQKPEGPATPGAQFFSNSFSNSTPDFGITISPTLGVTGGVYRVDHIYTSTANNVSTSIVLGVTNTEGCTISFTSTDKFQRSFGVVSGGKNQYQTLGFITNNVDTSTPAITFFYQSGVVSAGSSSRLIVDTFRFTLFEPCLLTPIVGIAGPIDATVPEIIVTGVTNATKVAVYQDSGSGMVKIGELTSGVVDGNNTVPVTGLVKGAQVTATQTVNGQEGCVSAAGLPVGGGANPRIRVALSIRETALTGPVGADGTGTADIHFLGATTRTGGAPAEGIVIQPGTNWQTVTLQRGPDFLNPIDNAVKWNAAVGSSPVDTVNDLKTDWGILEAIAFAIDDLTDSGPYDLYIDNLQNGATVWQDFESATVGQAEVSFRNPGFSGSTVGNILGAPNQSVVSNNTGDSSAQSLRVRFQWNGLTSGKWLRLTTSGVGNPMVDLAEPISFRILLVPVGTTVNPPVPDAITINRQGSNVILDWAGSFTLQEATVITGPFTDVPGPVTTGPVTNNVTGTTQKFFRLRN